MKLKAIFKSSKIRLKWYFTIPLFVTSWWAIVKTVGSQHNVNMTNI